MKIDVTRRDVLKFGAGAAVGVMATPAPWKAIDDLAIWTQNWKWIPVPPKGPVTMRATTCSLCAAGCAVSARCVGGLPVSMRAAAKEQALCALGLTAHHIPYHPARLTSPARVVRATATSRRVTMPLAGIVAEARKAIAEGRGSIAVLDARPGRSSSIAWRRFLSTIPRGVYLPAPGREGGSLATVASMLGDDADSLAYDLGNARTIVSFGAPLAEGWGDPRLTQRLLRRDPALHLVQVEPIRSETAAIAGRWLPVLPGTEAVLALGIAHVLVTERLVSPEATAQIDDFDAYAARIAQFTPESVSRSTRIPASEIVNLARSLVQDGPSVVVAGEDPGGGRFGRVAETAIAGLNLLLGNVGQAGGIVHRDPLPSPLPDGTLAASSELHRVDDRSIALLIVDASEGEASVPWEVVRRKLIADAPLVVALTPFFAGLATHADFVVPTPSFGEAIHEVTAPFDEPRPALALAAPLVQPRVQSQDPMSFLAAVAGAGGTSEELVRERVAKIHSAASGSVTTLADGSSKPVADFASSDELWEALLAGARWSGEPSAQPSRVRWSIFGPAREELDALTFDGDRITDARHPLVLIARGTRDVTASAAVSPVMTKIYQESGLRHAASTIVMNPETAEQLKIRRDATVRVATTAGALLATLALDERVMPGVISASVGPSNAALGCGGADRGPLLLDILPSRDTWRITAASVVEA